MTYKNTYCTLQLHLLVKFPGVLSPGKFYLFSFLTLMIRAKAMVP